MKDEALLRKEMDDALELVNSCSDTLEDLLNQAKAAGGADRELVEKIIAANKACDEKTDRYLDAYRAYYAPDSPQGG
jgi:hypothetical protein